MEQICMAGREVLKDEKGIPSSVSYCVQLEKDGETSFTASEFKMEFEKMSSKQPLDLDVEQPNSERCTKNSCPVGNKSTSPGYTSFVSPTKNHRRCCTDSSENRASDSLDIFCRTGSLLDIPMNLTSSEFSFERLKLRRRTKSANGPVAASPGNAIFSPSGQWIFDSLEGTVMARALLKSTLLLQLGALDCAARQVRSRSVSTRKIKSSEFTSYSSGFCDTQLQKPKFAVTPFRKQRSKSNISEKVLVSGSTKNLKCPHQSMSSTHVSKGMLHCFWKNGIPYFVYSVDDDRGEVYMANAHKIESTDDKAVDYMYLFRSRTDGKKESRNRYNNTFFVGKMKVSSSLVLNSNRSRFLETEFVLFGAHDDHSREIQSSNSTLTKSKGLSKMMEKMFRSTLSFKRKSTEKIGRQSFQIEDFLQETFVDELSDTDKPGSMNNLAHDFAPNLELAAIVVNDYQDYSNREVAVGGWGLKFLEKVEVNNANTSPESSSCEESCTRNRREPSRSMNVLVPSGFHGGPVTRIDGPSSLTDRWRSGGHCDCGGWDIGCPLTVLNNTCIYSEDSPQMELQEDCKSSTNLFREGVNHGEPILKMVNMNEGLYFIYFQPSLSALQSFSIGVAIIHTQTPGLDPKL